VTGYVSRRILQSLPVIVGIVLVSFLLIRLAPGDPASVLLGPRATPESLAALRAQLALDQPLPVQLAAYLGSVAVLDFGTSTVHRAPVAEVLGGRLFVSLALLAYAVIISLLIAVPLGLLSALRRNRLTDHAVRLLTMVTFAMPAFWLGLMLVLLFSLWLGLLPTSGLGREPLPFVLSLTLPALTMGLYLAPLLLRSLRSSAVETLGSEFIEAARARGLSERRIVSRHVLRNSLMAMITVLGVNIGFLLSGAVVIENVFAIPGLGSLLVSSIVARDFAVIQTLTLVFGVAVIAINILTDLSYAWLDPRVRL
jgi:peptide/nickel transport system permease protein